MLPALAKWTHAHWNVAVSHISQGILQYFSEEDQAKYYEQQDKQHDFNAKETYALGAVGRYNMLVRSNKNTVANREAKWKALEEMAAKKRAAAQEK